MGFKLAMILGALLLASLAGSASYIKHLNNQMAVLKGNQVILENQIEEQNASIDAYLKKQEQVSFQLKSMEAEKNEALREFNSLRDKFSKHDMDSLALAKPKLIEKRVNNGTRKVKEALVKITDPDQFEPQEEPVVTPEIKIETPDAKADIRG
jgi:chromosome segregation ATPase